MGAVAGRRDTTRERLALHTAAGLTVTAVGMVSFQLLTAIYVGGSPISVLLGLGLLAIALVAGFKRQLWLSAAGFLMAIPLLLLHAIGLLVPVDGPTPPEFAVDLWVLSIGVMVAGVGIAMLALSYHVAVRVVEALQA
ncbi:hypothetical protein [Natrarchaeobaculum sulfurireducens]|uniref:Uncharacterized protein n=1 Tax=Natrarchaeobaculum sulfurireducens TaxID=2044521 RepID=A0A346PJ08_9EURY|nr:hypothetical protein [Natrarchaeobaculum sulfurireducens]AXR79503.1 hypothetical protein AArc1_3198 [Natrarchaeobaculum sulfurireducens]